MTARCPNVSPLRTGLKILVSLALLLTVPALASARHPSGGKRPEHVRFTQVFDAADNIGPVYYPAHAAPDDPERRAAQQLAHYLEKISGKKWEVLPEPASLSARGIFIGRTHRAFADGLWRADNPHAPLQLPTDRIELNVTPTRISLVGENPQATLSGVYRFLETSAGVRWYAPGKLGEEVPEHASLRLLQQRSHRQPSFRDRGYHVPARNKDFRLWTERMGGSNHFDFNHNLHRIFTPALFAEHPEYWAQVDGRRRPPGRNERTSQLDYTNPAIAQITAQAARTAFDADPHRHTFSLGINDTIDFGDDEVTLQAISPLRYAHGHPVFSDLVFTFANDAARQIAQTHPDRYLPVLAYMWAEQLPSFAPEPNLMPYLCLDHSQWHDPDRRQADMELTRQWASSGVRELGTWEYLHGGGFFIPRIFNRLTAESLKFSHAEGFRSLFLESGSNVGFDASKMWLATSLAWDINADPAALLHDFYNGYYGVAGATMQELFEYCERIWMEQEGEAYWLKYFLNINQAALYPPQVLQNVNALLAKARAELAAADAPERFRQRLQQTADNFAYLQAASNYYHIYISLLTMPLKSAQDAQAFLQLDAQFATARQALEQAPRMQMGLPWEMRPQLLQLRPGGRLAAEAWKQPQIMAEELTATSATPAAPLLSIAQISGAANARLLAREDFSTELIAGDAAGFTPQKSTSGLLPSGWNLRWTHHENARLLRQRSAESQAISTEAIASERGVVESSDDHVWELALNDQEFLSLFRWIELPENAGLAGTRLEVLGEIAPACQLRINLAWLDANHKPVGENIYNLLPPGEYADWQDLAIAAERPEGAVWLYIGIRLQNQTPEQMLRLRNWETFYW